MTQIEIPLKFDNFPKQSEELRILKEVNDGRAEAGKLMADERVMDALQKSIEGLRVMREFPDFNNTEFRALLVAVIFDLAEIHFQLKDYKQSEKELDTLFKVLDSLVKNDEERFGKLHILAMELSTRILRSRKKALDLLVKQQINAAALYEKVNSGVAAATDRLVDSLSNVAQLLASTGDLKGALKFYSEAIKFSKKRTGRVTRKEIKLTIEMAEIMMRIKQMRPRALRLLNAILPHAIALETLELERDILSLKSLIESEPDNEPKWKNFFHQLTVSAKAKLKKFSKSETAENKGTDESETQE
ncbi:hypothetical protein [Lepagella muris]|uniref:Uncharacterized protein n=1 Tax=Lepagella muris TaxID=3032870 RepID=A0AC61RF38_9BACT|nr:hypothetical protein [Lepagella muris]TGY77833.1 hypothetical protein E5331_12565 [Lepagella muris]THG51287.1 hypothetical protein E5984_11765 [Bacteroidales bacterium]TKC64235.1 hypothetical protein E5359_002730 [Bacteroidales bacterium]